jgi:hypothetical protein
MGWRRATVIAACLCLLGFGIRWMIATHDELMTHLLDTVAYTVAPAGLFAIGCVIWNLAPYHI